MYLFLVTLYVDHHTGHPAYDIPGPLLFLHESRIVRRNEGRIRIEVPMQNVCGDTWEELYGQLETFLSAPVEGDRALVYRALSVLGGGTSLEPKLIRQVDIGVLYGVPELEGWERHDSLKSWWDQQDLAGTDRRLAEAAPRYASLLSP